MKKEDLIAKGLSEEQAKAVLELYNAEIREYVPKADYDSANRDNNALMLIKATPADTGYLKENWYVVITKVGGGYEAEIINNTEYASYVNYGHRQTPGRYVPAIGKKLKKGWVDGKFFIELSVAELRGKARPLIENMLEQYLKEAFK